MATQRLEYGCDQQKLKIRPTHSTKQDQHLWPLNFTAFSPFLEKHYFFIILKVKIFKIIFLNVFFLILLMF